MSDGTLSWADLIHEASSRLATALGGDRSQEARWIIERVSGCGPTELRVNDRELVSARSVAFYDALVARRSTGEPLQYVLGRWAFRTLDLHVTADVLIPRPETEHVAGFAIAAAARLATATGRAPVVVDLGTGSGAIALSIAVEVPSAQVWATDVSSAALTVARANLAGLGRAATRVTMAEGSWFDALPRDLAGDVDVLVSNPPYVAPSAELPNDVRDWEPHLALFAADDGFAALRTLLDGAPSWLRADGTIVLEMGETQTEWASAHAHQQGYVDIETIIDLTDRPRGIVARWPGRAGQPGRSA